MLLIFISIVVVVVVESYPGPSRFVLVYILLSPFNQTLIRSWSIKDRRRKVRVVTFYYYHRSRRRRVISWSIRVLYLYILLSLLFNQKSFRFFFTNTDYTFTKRAYNTYIDEHMFASKPSSRHEKLARTQNFNATERLKRRPLKKSIIAVKSFVIKSEQQKRDFEGSERTDSTKDWKKENELLMQVLRKPEFSVLLEALERSEVIEAVRCLERGTLIAPTNEAFDRFFKKKRIAKEQFMRTKNVSEILTYHCLRENVSMKRMRENGQGQYETMCEGKSVTAKEIEGKRITEADVECGGVTVHAVDGGIVAPVFSVPADFSSATDIFALPRGWAPEVLNGRMAMIGFVMAVLGEISTGHGIAQQFTENFSEVLHSTLVWSVVSFAPALSSNEGYSSNPKTMMESRTWNYVFKGSVVIPKYIQPVFTAEVESLNGRGAMIGCLALALVEAFKGSALF